MEHPLITVIVPTYNRSTYLKETLDSIVSQTYKNIEILVIDDGSIEIYADTICKAYSNCTYLFKENGGLSSARNFGIHHAKGSLIAFVDDDDFWRADKLEKQVKILIENEGVDLVHSSAQVVDIDSKPTGKIIGASKDKAHLRSGNVFWNALGLWVVKSPTPLIRRRALDTGFLFDESIKIGEDIDFYQRFFYKYKVWYISEPLAYYRMYDDENRLSLQRERYVGLEQKMFENFKNMGVTNPLILYRIARRILGYAIGNWNTAYPEKSLKISKFIQFFRPQFALKHYFNK